MALSLKLCLFSSVVSYLPSTSQSSLNLLSSNHLHGFFPISPPLRNQPNSLACTKDAASFRVSYRYRGGEEEDDDAEDSNFSKAVTLFNKREYYKCHDHLEALWNTAEEPTRTLIHGILQCAVGLHHLFNQIHKGAMMELGEGLCKLKKMNFSGGPFHQFEQEISAALEFIYQTQIELAACGDEACFTMDQSERSYHLLGEYAAGQHIYKLQVDTGDTMYVVFGSQRSYINSDPPRVKLPSLHATEEHLLAFYQRG